MNDQEKAKQAKEQAAATEAYKQAMAKATETAKNPNLVPAIPTRDEIRASIKQSATLLGCDEKGTVSGAELLMMFALCLRSQGLMPDAPNAAVRAICGLFDSNSSAMSKRLYDSPDSAPKADKYAGLV